MFERTRATHIIHICKRSIFQCIEKHNLPFHVLNETKKDIRFFAVRSIGIMFIKKFPYYLSRTLFFMISFFTIREQQRKENACFFYPVKGQGRKKTVIQLKF